MEGVGGAGGFMFIAMVENVFLDWWGREGVCSDINANAIFYTCPGALISGQEPGQLVRGWAGTTMINRDRTRFFALPDSRPPPLIPFKPVKNRREFIF